MGDKLSEQDSHYKVQVKRKSMTSTGYDIFNYRIIEPLMHTQTRILSGFIGFLKYSLNL